MPPEYHVFGCRQSWGLFGVAQDAVIENLTVRGNIDLTGVRSYDTTTGYIIGGVLGSGEGGGEGSGVTIRNCVSQVDISVAFAAGEQKSQNSAVGGLVGRLSGSGSHEITDCRNEGRVYTSFAPGAYYLGGSGGNGGPGRHRGLYRCQCAAEMLRQYRHGLCRPCGPVWAASWVMLMAAVRRALH